MSSFQLDERQTTTHAASALPTVSCAAPDSTTVALAARRGLSRRRLPVAPHVHFRRRPATSGVHAWQARRPWRRRTFWRGAPHPAAHTRRRALPCRVDRCAQSSSRGSCQPREMSSRREATRPLGNFHETTSSGRAWRVHLGRGGGVVRYGLGWGWGCQGRVRGVVRGGRDGVRMGLCVRKGLYWASNGLHTNIGPRELDPMRKQRGREQRLVTQVRRTAFVEARIVPCKTKRIQLHTHRHRQTQTDTDTHR